MIRHRKSARGAELLELTIALPILLLSFAAIVDFAFMFQRLVVLQNAAREGARIAVLPGYFNPSGTNDVVRARVRDYVQAGCGYIIDLGDASTGTITVAADATLSPIEAVRVEVTAPYEFTFLSPIVAMFQGGSFAGITLRAGSSMRSET